MHALRLMSQTMRELADALDTETPELVAVVQHLVEACESMKTLMQEIIKDGGGHIEEACARRNLEMLEKALEHARPQGLWT